jgi:hypothetical protein
MRNSIRVFAAAALGAAMFVPAAHGQDMTTYSFGGTTLYIGGGFQYLSLPDIKYTGRGTEDVFDGARLRSHQKNSDFSEYGPAAGAGIETAIGYWNGMRVTAGVKGFYTWLDNSDRTRCSGGPGCVIFDPTGELVGQGDSFVTNTNRDVDYWGGQAEFKFGRAKPVHEKPNFYRNDYFIVGADIRGIDQDTKLATHPPSFPTITYRETLDTTYYGGYIGFGGEYSFGFIPGIKNVGGLYDRLGLRTFVNLRAGLYNAETDYNGRFSVPSFAEEDFPGFRSRLSKSNDELAFIGTVSLETRKQLGARTSLSLWTDYEYISSVPKMRYVSELGETARIDNDWAWGSRTMLRLNIGLGSRQLYEEPLK